MQAYQDTDYCVSTEIPFLFNIKKISLQLGKIHQKFNCSSSAFLTAYCPFSNPLPINENENLQQLLEEELVNMDLFFLNGYGQGKGLYSERKERSVLVLGISLIDATKLAKKYNQNAFVWIDANCIPQLVFPH